MSVKVLLIGAGPTNTLIAYIVKSCPKLSKILDIHIWEKVGEVGGRFMTSTYNDIPADLGAQYLSQTTGLKWSEPIFADLLKSGLLEKLDVANINGFRLDDKKENYICAKGTTSIVKHFLKNSNVEETQILPSRRILRLSTGDSSQIEAFAENACTSEAFDLVVSTIPIPELLESNIIQDNLLTEPSLKDVKYTCRFALALFFKHPIELMGDEKQFNFIRKENNPICYWALVNPSAIVVHTNVNFGKDNVEQRLENMKDFLLQKTFIEVKSIHGIEPIHVNCHLWRHSQVETPFKNSPGFFELNKSPYIILAGDGFTYSGIEGCMLSALRTTEYIRELAPTLSELQRK